MKAFGQDMKSMPQRSPAPFKLIGSLSANGTHLRWKPVRRATVYAIEWLDQRGVWRTLWLLEGDEITPNSDGMVEYVNRPIKSVPSGGTYRVSAYFDPLWEGKPLSSAPVVVASARPPKSSKKDLIKRLNRRRTPAGVKTLITQLRWSRGEWTMLLPQAVGKFLGQRIALEVQNAQLTDAILDLLQLIFVNLPKLVARAEKAFEEHGGLAALEEEERISRPRIVIDPETRGAWTVILEIKDSDYAWHIEFVRAKFKEIWGGD